MTTYQVGYLVGSLAKQWWCPNLNWECGPVAVCGTHGDFVSLEKVGTLPTHLDVRSTNSSSDQSRSVTPAAIAGVVRSVL
jgi:hypothetical protein